MPPPSLMTEFEARLLQHLNAIVVELEKLSKAVEELVEQKD